MPGEVIEEWFLCGPYGMVVDAREVLTARGVPESAVHTELFHVDAPPEPVRRPGDEPGAGAEVTIVLDGRSSSFTMGRDERVLDAALRSAASCRTPARAGSARRAGRRSSPAR